MKNKIISYIALLTVPGIILLGTSHSLTFFIIGSILAFGGGLALGYLIGYLIKR
jgi:hypothetical protein